LEELLSDSILEFSTVNKKNLDEIVGLVEELVINKVRIEKMKNEFYNNAHIKILDQELRIISEIQESIKKVRLIKMKTINSFLGDLIDKCNKEYNTTARFLFEGQETEIENSLTNYIRNILTYFIKNIYQNEFNVTENHSNQIKISASSDGKNLITVIESNGTGFDYEGTCKIFNRASLDLLSFNEDEIRKFFSIINVTNNIEELIKLKSDLVYLDGSIKFESKLNESRRITISVPLSSSIMKGILITVGNEIYAIPLEFIETIINKKAVSIKNSNNTEMILYMDKVIKLVRLSEILDVQTTEESSCILIVSANNKRAALLVDSLMDQTDMVIKPKHHIIKDVSEVKGTTILGDGLVTLVLDVPSILKKI
jgi:chemotaxis protein histidine kinase CheA